MDEIFTALDVPGLKQLPGELGAFSVESLFVRYSFSLDELIGAFRTLGTTDRLPEPLKTVVHETTHLFHTTATPFGFLIYALRRFQASVVGDTINALRLRHQVKVRYPLIDFLLQLPRGIQAHVGPQIRAWYEAELFILMALGNPNVWLEQAAKNPILMGLPNPEFFGRIQRYLAMHYRWQADNAAFLAGQPTEEAAPLPFASFGSDQPELVGSKKDYIDLLFLQSMANDANMIAVTESAGGVAEYWGAERLSCGEIFDQLHGTFAARGVVSGFTRQALGALHNARKPRDIVLSYLALCDLSLFGPVLPQHKHLRVGRKVRLDELFPFLRFRELSAAAHDVRPMESLKDYERYTSELCRALGWTPPGEIVRLADKDYIHIDGDAHEFMYLKACAYRAEWPWIFQDYSFLLAANNDLQRQFLMDFNFPVIQYRDQTVYHRDKVLLEGVVRWYLLRSALRAILLRNRIALQMPYRPKNQQEIAFLRETLLRDLKMSTGLSISDLTIT
jgi:hypothetical protein